MILYIHTVQHTHSHLFTRSTTYNSSGKTRRPRNVIASTCMRTPVPRSCALNRTLLETNSFATCTIRILLPVAVWFVGLTLCKALLAMQVTACCGCLIERGTYERNTAFHWCIWLQSSVCYSKQSKQSNQWERDHQVGNEGDKEQPKAKIAHTHTSQMVGSGWVIPVSQYQVPHILYCQIIPKNPPTSTWYF